MSVYQYHCRWCKSPNTKHLCTAKNGKNRFYCHDCKRHSTENPNYVSRFNPFPEKVRKAAIVLLKITSYRHAAKLTGISVTTLFAWNKSNKDK